MKRLVASIAIAGRGNGFSDAEREGVMRHVAASYRTAMASFASMRDLDVWYSRLAIQDGLPLVRKSLDKRNAKMATAIVDKARTKDSMQAFERLTKMVDGERRIASDPPLIVSMQELLPAADADQIQGVAALVGPHVSAELAGRSSSSAGRFSLRRRRAQGGGGRQRRHACLHPVVRRPRRRRPALPAGQGGTDVRPGALRRQVLLRESGATGRRGTAPPAGGQRHLPRVGSVHRSRRRRARLLHPSAPRLEGLLAPGGHGSAGDAVHRCRAAWTLARGHARSGDRIAIASYLGKSDTFDRAIATFSEAYADQNERDFEALQAAAADGRIKVESGL